MKRLLLLAALIFFLPHTTHAAWLFYGGYELNSNTDGVEITTNSAPTATTSTAHSGSYGGRVNAGAGFWRQVPYTSNQTATGTIRVWVNPHAYPNASTRLVYLANAANTFQGNITMTTSGTLTLLAANGTQIGSASSALPLDTWSCVEFMDEPTTGANGKLTGRLNGSNFASGNNSAAGSWARGLWGNVTGAQTTNDVAFDDVAITDGLTGFPGCGSSVFMQANAAGDSNSWLQTGGGAGGATNYTLTNEKPPDDATSMVQTGTLNNEDLYNFANSGLQTYDTINALLIAARYRNDTADATASFKVEWEAAASGTKGQSAAYIPNSTTWTSYGVQASKADSYPIGTTTTPTGASLTSTVLDAMQAGFILSAANTNKVQITNLWAYADYTAGTPPPAAATTDQFILFQ